MMHLLYCRHTEIISYYGSWNEASISGFPLRAHLNGCISH